MTASRRRPGDQVVLHEVWRDRVWSARPVTVVEDTGSFVALYLAEGTRWKMPRAPDGTKPRMPLDDWTLLDVVWWHDSLYLAELGVPHAVLPIWGDNDRALEGWYVNLQEPLRRTPAGFAYMDQTLDIIGSPDRTSWRWKDDEDFEEAIALGLFTPEQGREIRAEGERAIRLMLDGQPPFDGRWDHWRPDPAWPVPELPPNWDAVPG